MEMDPKQEGEGFGLPAYCGVQPVVVAGAGRRDNEEWRSLVCWQHSDQSRVTGAGSWSLASSHVFHWCCGCWYTLVSDDSCCLEGCKLW